MKIEWTSDIELGIATIDDDHRIIIDFYNKIFDLYDNQIDAVLMERAIIDFRFLFAMHFLKEENFMAEIGYPDFDAHAKEHEHMISLLCTFSQENVTSSDSCQKIAFLVLQWISSHLKGADRSLANYARTPAVT